MTYLYCIIFSKDRELFNKFYKNTNRFNKFKNKYILKINKYNISQLNKLTKYNIQQIKFLLFNDEWIN
tara:strand:- start:3505 stop:3708 length:204 start_codon:yes stop_codon:yes gene_type:complete